MIYVTLIHDVHPEAVGRVCYLVGNVYQTNVELLKTSFAAETSFDRRRQQYSSTVLLEMLLEEVPDPDDKVVAITAGDLFIPVLTFVFGEAQLDGNVAIVSTFRLRDQYYGLPDNQILTVERLEKEVVHELGHTFGLRHCENYKCVMSPSTGVEEIDLKDTNLCGPCIRLLFGQEEEAVG
jgi:archaemetzincin